MSTIWLVIVEDRHTDVEVYPFSNEQRARVYADRVLEEYGGKQEDEDDGETGLTAGMKASGWIYYARYSVEGDSIRIIKRKLDA